MHNIPLRSRGAVPRPRGEGGGSRSGGRLPGHYLQQLVQGCGRVRHLAENMRQRQKHTPDWLTLLWGDTFCSLYIQYELNFEGHSNKAVFSIQLMPRQYLLLYSLAFCSLRWWSVTMVTHITPIITLWIDCRPFAIPWDWAFQKLNNSFTDDFKIKHGHGFLALVLSQPGYRPVVGLVPYS